MHPKPYSLDREYELHFGVGTVKAWPGCRRRSRKGVLGSQCLRDPDTAAFTWAEEDIHFTLMNEILAINILHPFCDQRLPA
jgi:hypothetical protein